MMTTDTTLASPAGLDESFALPASDEQLTRAADALTARGFAVEILDDAAAARSRLRELLPAGAAGLSSARGTRRPARHDDDVNASRRHPAIPTQTPPTAPAPT